MTAGSPALPPRHVPVHPPAPTPWEQDYRCGARQVALKDLRAKVGKPAWKVWTFLAAIRDPTRGVTRVTDAGLAVRLGMPRSSVKRALERLRASGLVRGWGWKEQRVPRGTGTTLAVVYLRVIRGRVPAGQPRFSTQVAFVPAATFQWMTQRASAWGGRRSGAGRPPRSGAGLLTTCGNQDGSTGGAVEKSSRIPGSLSYGERSGKHLSPPEKDPPRPAARDAAGSDPDLSGVVYRGDGIDGPGQAPSYPDLYRRRGLIPPRPSVPIPVTPPAPLIRWTMIQDAEILVAVKTSYLSAFAKRYGKRAWQLRPKHDAALVTLGRALAAAEIPPAAWFLWTFDGWKGRAGEAEAKLGGDRRTMKRGKEPPPVALSLSAASVGTQAGWFRASAGPLYLGGTSVYTREHVLLMKTWDRMALAAARGQDWRGSVISPEGFEGMIRDARSAAARTEADLRERAARWECLWG